MNRDEEKSVEKPGAILVIAHRGASGYAPENTLAAFRKAIEMGADMYELDCYSSKDGAIVVMHEDFVKRTTNGTGKLTELTLDEIKKLDAGSWFGSKFTGETVPTLREALELANGKVKVNIEIKQAGIEKRVVELVGELGMDSEVIVTSFDHSAIKKFKEINPKIMTGALVLDIAPDEIEGKILPLGADALNPRLDAVNSKLVTAAHARGLKVNPYTVNNAASMRMMIENGVDGIISNYPDVLLRLLGREKAVKNG